MRANDPDAIALNKDVVSFDADDAGVTVHFADGTSAKGSVLIGCDGSSRCCAISYGTPANRTTLGLSRIAA